MKIFIITGILIIKVNIAFVFSQVDMKDVKQYNTIYTESRLDTLPKFPGGKESLLEYYFYNFDMTKAIHEAAGERKQYIILKLFIDKNGKVEIIDIYDSSIYQVIKEFRRLSREMPDWQPAYKNKERVGTWVVLPISYRIRDRFLEQAHGELIVNYTENKKNALLKGILLGISLYILYCALSVR